MKQTPNYNLPQFDGLDKFTKEDFNDAFSKIDLGISDIQETINTSNGDTIVIANEVVQARKGEINLPKKIEKIDENITKVSSQLEHMTNVKSENESAIVDGELVDSNGWTIPTGWTGSFSAGFKNTVGNTNKLIRTMTSTGTKRYLVKFRVESPTPAGEPNASTDFTVRIGNSLDFVTYKGGGNYDYSFGIQSISDGNLEFIPGSTFDGTIKNISVKEIKMPTSPTYIIKDSSSKNTFELRPGNNTLRNVFLGVNAGKYSIEGDNNVAVGVDALPNNTTGYWNTSIGSETLVQNTVGSRNVALGYLALNSNISGDRNYAIGTFSLYRNTTGRENISVGADTMWYNTTGSNNVALGQYAMGSNTTGSFNIALGNASLNENVDGSYNIAIGVDSMLRNKGIQNIGIGRNALKNIATSNTIAIGNGAGALTTTGEYNTVLGNSALSTNIGGSNNTVIGNSSGQGTSGNINRNVLLGDKTGHKLTTGGDQNTIIGTHSGQELTTGNNNILIGYNVQASSNNSSGDVNIGNLIKGNVFTKRMTIGTEITQPTAILHLPTSTETIPSLKLSVSALTTSPHIGAIEFDGTNLYFTNSSGTRKTIATL